ncbi:response regulator transcription factor [Puteibacter caeruleilacunae]|nr:response regulator transcription factor [Puteibacter caeruleilacunae]
MKCIIIDDEPLALDLLEDFIQRVPFLSLQEKFNEPFDAFRYIQDNEIDLIFLDIEMPSINGVEFVKSLSQKPQIIFTTAHSHYALEGYELEITDYLIKPFLFDRFLKAVNKAYRMQRLFSNKTKPAEQAPARQNFILVKTGYNTVKVNLDDILYIEGLKDYIKIHLTDKSILTLNSLKKVQDKLPDDIFVRVHRSYIVSLARIDSIQRNRIVIGKDHIPLGENYRAAFNQKIKPINI